MTDPTPQTVAPVYEALRAGLPAGSRFGLALRLTPEDDVVLELDVIVVPVELRGQGVGARLLRALTAAADAHGWTLALRVTGDLGTEPSALRRFYARHGFRVASAGRLPDDLDLIRAPHPH